MAPGDDLIMSNMYSLLNYIAATSKDISENSTSSQIFSNPLYVAAPDRTTLQSEESGLRGLSEDEKRLVGISTISVVTRLALEFQMEEVSPTFKLPCGTHVYNLGNTLNNFDASSTIALCRTDR